MLSTQWFVRMELLAAPAIKAVREGDIKFVPERFDAIYFHWMENIRDWYLLPALVGAPHSRLLLRPPRRDRGVGRGTRPLPQMRTRPSDPRPRHAGYMVLSGLWPFSTLGCPDETPRWTTSPHQHPLHRLDIIFFWVARMIVSGYACTDKAPLMRCLSTAC